MKRILSISLLFLLLSTAFSFTAEAMSEKQILQYIAKEQANGKSQKEIATELLKKGVSVQELQRIRQKYKKQNNSLGTSKSSTKSSDSSQDAEDSMRSNKRSISSKDRQERESSFMVDPNQDVNGIVKDSLQMLRDLLKKQKEEDPTKKIFGHDIFNNEDLSFEPNTNLATPTDYILGPGDELVINIYGASQNTIVEEVTPDGMVVVENYGPIKVAGLTVDQAIARVRNQLGQRYVSSKIDLSVSQIRSIRVNVMGEVTVPGTYTVSGLASVFHVLYMAGGVNNIGTLRNIKVYRNNSLLTIVDIYDYLLNGKLSGNIRLNDNDVVVVGPYEALVSIQGKVKRPMYYELKRNETFSNLLDYAGGFANNAYTRMSRVIRKAQSGIEVYTLEENQRDSFTMADGDSISVDSIAQRFLNMVDLRGAVHHPGMYQLGSNIRTVKQLLEIADGVKEDAFLPRAVMHRMRKNRTLEVISIDLEGILKGSAADVELQNEDVVFIPSLNEKNERQTLTIRGEVFYPGTYQFAENMTLEDFILQAGGLTDAAATNNVEVARRNSSKTSDNKPTSFTISLKEGFAIDGQAGFRLEPYDEVYVRKNSSIKTQESVTIEGEILFSGSYLITEGKNRVSDILKMAGGLSSQAAPNGTYVIRTMNDEERRQRIENLDKERTSYAYTLSHGQQMSANSRSSFVDSLLVEQRLRDDVYRVAVDLPASIENPGSISDLVLREGDRIFVEPYKNTVEIKGVVPHQNVVPYVKGKNIKYYLGQAGSRGRKDRKWAYIVYQNGTSAMVRSGAKVEPGCEIILPEHITKSNTQQNVSMWVSIGSTLATMGAVVATLLR